MLNDSSKNKFLLLYPGVVRSPITDAVIFKLDKYFAAKQHVAYVTSIKRTAEDQLRTIKEYCILNKIDKEFPEIRNCSVSNKLPDGTYIWQKAWSRLLNKGVIINPPLAAVVLFDYYKNGKNKKGEVIPPSGHFYGDCFDIGGKGGIDLTPNDELEVISYAMGQDKDLGIESFLLERNNNCLHVKCKNA